MLGQVIEKNKMLKAHILATALPISSKLCGIAMCVPWAWFRKAYLLFMLKHWLIQVLEMRVPTVDCVIKHGGQANPICQLCQARDESTIHLMAKCSYGEVWNMAVAWINQWSPNLMMCIKSNNGGLKRLLQTTCNHTCKSSYTQRRIYGRSFVGGCSKTGHRGPHSSRGHHARPTELQFSALGAGVIGCRCTYT